MSIAVPCGLGPTRAARSWRRLQLPFLVVVAVLLVWLTAVPAAATPTAGRAKRTGSAAWRPGAPSSFVIGPYAGGAWRLGEPPAFSLRRRGGMTFGLDTHLFLAGQFAVGLAYEQVSLGAIESGVQPSGLFRAAYDAHGAWLSMRLYPFATEWVGVALLLAAGGSWQGAEVAASLWSPTQPDQAQSFTCSGSGSLAPALRVGASLEGRLRGGLRPTLTTSFDNYAFGEAPLGNCVAGSGSVQTVSVRLGLTYAFAL